MGTVGNRIRMQGQILIVGVPTGSFGPEQSQRESQDGMTRARDIIDLILSFRTG